MHFVYYFIFLKDYVSFAFTLRMSINDLDITINNHYADPTMTTESRIPSEPVHEVNNTPSKIILCTQLLYLHAMCYAMQYNIRPLYKPQ